MQDKQTQNTNTQLKPLTIVKKIKLPSGMVPVDVGMLETHVIVVCQPNDNVFLFTTGLGPCVAALAYCKLKNGETIIGITHM
jgi:hypothetical protein